MIGIIGALDVEVAAIADRIEDKKVRRIGISDYISGKLFGQDVVIAQGGMGKVNAAIGTTVMIREYNPDMIINTGIGGALNKDLHVMDLVLAEKFVQHDVDSSAIGDPVGFVSTVNKTFFEADPDVVRRLKIAADQAGAKRCIIGVDATADQFVTDAAVKQRIIDLFGGDVCDMEGAAIAQVCNIMGTPCGAVRAISDGADDESHMSYFEFKPKAADLSANVVFNFVKTFND